MDPEESRHDESATKPSDETGRSDSAAFKHDTPMTSDDAGAQSQSDVAAGSQPEIIPGVEFATATNDSIPMESDGVGNIENQSAQQSQQDQPQQQQPWIEAQLAEEQVLVPDVRRVPKRRRRRKRGSIAVSHKYVL